MKDMEDGRNDLAMMYCSQVIAPSEGKRERLEEQRPDVNCAESVKAHHKGNALAEVWKMVGSFRKCFEKVRTFDS